MQISEEYRELNRKLHSDNPNYGVSGQRYAKAVQQLADKHGTNDILDYGCGKRTLEAALGYEIYNFDQCIEGLDTLPDAHAIVVCTDVLEHVEPACLDDVLAHVRGLAKTVAFFAISTRPAKKFLADGRNAHLIQEQGPWWLRKLWDAGFDVVQYQAAQSEVLVIAS